MMTAFDTDALLIANHSLYLPYSTCNSIGEGLPGHDGNPSCPGDEDAEDEAGRIKSQTSVPGSDAWRLIS